MVAAVFELLREGRGKPTADQIAARAGLSVRTVFRHLGDPGEVQREILERVWGDFQQRVRTARFEGDRAARVAALVRHRMELYEALGAFVRASEVPVERSAPHARGQTLLRQQLRRALGDALSRDDRERFEALDGILSYSFWNRLRHERRLPEARVERILARSVTALLDSAAEAS